MKRYDMIYYDTMKQNMILYDLIKHIKNKVI